MLRRRLLLLVLSVLIPSATARAEDPLPAAEEWIPRQALIVLSVRKPKALLDLALRPALIKAVESSPVYKAQSASVGFRQFRSVVKSLERRLEADWQSLLRRLVGGGATWAVGPNNGNLLIVDSLDAEAPRGLHELLLSFARAGAESRGQPDSVRPTKVGDVTTWSLGPNEAHAIIGNRLVIANGPKVLKAALGLRGASRGRSVAALPAYRQARKAAGADAAAMLYANTAVLKHAPNVAKALAGENNPLVSLLAAPVTEALRRSTWLALALKVDGDTLVLDAVSDGTIAPSGAARFAVPARAGDGASPNLTVPRRIAAMSLHRDLRGFYAAKDELFPERTSGLIFFENMMGIFFTGRDLTEEVLAETGPKIRLVVAEQKYDPAIGTPAAQFPAFAVVFALKDPAKFSLVVEEAWQKAVGLINFTRGQKAEPGLIIDRPVHRGTKYTVACFTPSEEGDKKAIDTRFNFRPALAMPGNHLILSSTDGLAEDIMDALSRETSHPPKPRAGVHSLVEIDGAQLASILAANRENLIRQNMVDKGSTRKQAESEVGLLLGLAKHVSRVALAVGADKGRSRASLHVHLALPSGDRGDK